MRVVVFGNGSGPRRHGAPGRMERAVSGRNVGLAA